MDRYWKEVLQVSTRKHGINVQYLYDSMYIVTEKAIYTTIDISKTQYVIFCPVRYVSLTRKTKGVEGKTRLVFLERQR